MRFGFIEEHRASFPAHRLCSVVGVSTSGLRAFRSRSASRRQRSDLVTFAHIKEQSRLSLGSCGRLRITEELKEIGLDVGHRRVGRLMREVSNHCDPRSTLPVCSSFGASARSGGHRMIVEQAGGEERLERRSSRGPCTTFTSG